MIVHGCGPRPCRLMIVGEKPGEIEASTGKPFHPRAAVGKELRRLVRHIMHIDCDDDVFLTNLIREYNPKHKDEKVGKEDIERWLPDLERELAEVQPEVIMTLGREATRYFLGNVNLEDVYGLPHRSNGSVVVPNYLRLYDTELLPVIWYGFRQCKAVMDGKLEPIELSKNRHPDYRLLRGGEVWDVLSRL